MAVFSVLLVTAAPAAQPQETGGAFVKIDGRESMLRCIELFLNRDNVKQIQIAFLPEAVEEARRKHGAHFSFSGVRVLSAGPRWVDQLAAASEHIAAEATHVIVHDAARPAVAYSDLEALMEAAEQSPTVALVTPVQNELVEMDEAANPMAIHRPDRYMQLLTPQVYARERFLAMAASRQLPHGSELALLKGSPLNVRLRGPGDASLVRAMLNLLPKPKIKGPSNPFEEAQW